MQKLVITVMVVIILPLMCGCAASRTYEFGPAAENESAYPKTPADSTAESESAYPKMPADSTDDPWPAEPPIQVTLSPEENEAIFLETLIDDMSFEEQVSQLFILSLGANITAPFAELESLIGELEAGGYILFSDNITTADNVKALTDAIGEFSKIAPFICIDEEGGAVSRLSSAGLAGYAAPAAAGSIGRSGDAQNAYLAGETIGNALFALGVNVDFAPVADVLTNPQNKVIGDRSFGSDPELVSDMASAFTAGLRSQGIMSAAKHFPGHGASTDDSHIVPAVIESSAEHLANIEYLPFRRLIGEGVEFIMVGHILASKVEPKGLPATLSQYFVTDVLRGELGFNGIICTDAMNMGAISKAYTSGQAAVQAIKAGVDMILMPSDYNDAKNGVIEAIHKREIPIGRIRESLRRILRVKLASGLITLK